MLREFVHRNGRLAQADDSGTVVWTDLFEPTEDEVGATARAFGAPLPSREDMHEIEISSRLYHDHGADYITVLVPARVADAHREAVPVSFVLREDRLVTIRHHDPKPFTTYPERAAQMPFGCGGADAVLLGLFEEIIDRIADILEQTTTALDGESRRLFRPGPKGRPKPPGLVSLLEAIGRSGDLVTDLRTCIVTLERAISYLGPILVRRNADDGIRAAVEVQKQDLKSLGEHAGFLSQKTSFLLEATLGVVNIEQNANIKLFSVIAVLFLPPTLIASIYGMNFHAMPELSWSFGYPLAILAMIAAAVLPIAWFRFRGWL